MIPITETRDVCFYTVRTNPWGWGGGVVTGEETDSEVNERSLCRVDTTTMAGHWREPNGYNCLFDVTPSLVLCSVLH
jgi:hypothetical protein